MVDRLIWIGTRRAMLSSPAFALGSPPGWQIALSIAVMIATIGGSAIVCARIYRLGMLMYGKRLTLREVGRWLRYA